MAPQKGRKRRGDPPTKILGMTNKAEGAKVPRPVAPPAPAQPSSPISPPRAGKRLKKADGTPLTHDVPIAGKGKEKVGQSHPRPEGEAARRSIEPVERSGKASKDSISGRGPEDLTHLGWDDRKFKEYRADDYPGRASVVHQYACSKTPVNIREIPGEHVRKATELVARAWTRPLDKAILQQGQMDNLHLSMMLVANGLVTAQRAIAQVAEQEESARLYANTARQLTEEKDGLVGQYEAKIARLNNQINVYIDAEHKRLEEIQVLSKELKDKEAVLGDKEVLLGEGEKKLTAAEQEIAELKAENARLREAEANLFTREQLEEEVQARTGPISNLGYICAYADSIRSADAYDFKDLVEEMAKDLNEFMEHYPPPNNIEIQLADLAVLGVKLDKLDPSISITHPPPPVDEGDQEEEVAAADEQNAKEAEDKAAEDLAREMIVEPPVDQAQGPPLAEQTQDPPLAEQQ